jgi:hypothetical protein
MRKDAVLVLDWTEYDADDHCTIAAYLITTHGRATPLVWKTVPKSTLKSNRTGMDLAASRVCATQGGRQRWGSSSAIRPPGCSGSRVRTSVR